MGADRHPGLGPLLEQTEPCIGADVQVFLSPGAPRRSSEGHCLALRGFPIGSPHTITERRTVRCTRGSHHRCLDGRGSRCRPYSGVIAHSLLLVAFGLDSVIELVTGGVLLWRLITEARGSSLDRIEHAENRAAWITGMSLSVLCVYVVVSAVAGLSSITKPTDPRLASRSPW